MERLRPTVADYMVVAISPALIIALVSSLVLFLAEVTYGGPDMWRLRAIFFLFVFAAVLISRIAMEKGSAYAAAYGVPLALVTYLAMFILFQASGLLAAFSWLINAFLIALVWWSAYKLTWDCTILDRQQDASGQGLLQTMGWGSSAQTNIGVTNGTSESPAGPPPVNPATADTSYVHPAVAATQSISPQSVEDTLKRWWRKLAEWDKRPHAHGRWVIYYSLAALPLFGLGQMFIPGEDLPLRRYAFFLMCVYVASGLGLLVTTSFLSIRRYLRQRQLEMPADMAGTWIGVGAALIVGLMVAVWLLPRPAPEYSVTQLTSVFKSQEDWQTSRYGVGNEGRYDEDASRSGNAENDPSGASSGQQSGDRNSTGGSSQDQSNQGGTSGNQDQSGSQTSPSNQGQNDHSAGGDERSQNGQPQEQEGDGENSNNGDSQQDGSGGRNSQDNSNGQSSRSGQSSSSGGSTQSSRSGNNQQHASPNRPSSESNQSGDGDQSRGSKSSQSQNEQRSDSGSESRSSQPFRPLAALAQGVEWLTVLFKWLVVLALIAVLAFFAWRYRAQLLQAWRRFVAQLQELWERLFGHKQQATIAAIEEEQAAVRPSRRPFADYADPFETGLASRQSPEQLVRYSFEAFEAWAHERGCPRQPEQTPHEFARAVGAVARELASDARQLADLYCRVAYARGALPAESVHCLRRFWRQLRNELVAV